MAEYENEDVKSSNFVDVTGIHDFLKKFIYPAIDENCIIYGDQNNISLPAGTNEYCLFYVENGSQSATTIENYDPVKEELTLYGKKELIIRVDLYSDSLNGSTNAVALQRAQNLQTIFKSSVGVRALKNLGLIPLFADDPADTTINSDDSGNYLYRWMIKLHCYINHSITLHEEGFKDKPKIVLNSILAKADQPTDTSESLHVSNIDIKIKDSE